jgi:hypothetical protein
MFFLFFAGAIDVLSGQKPAQIEHSRQTVLKAHSVTN